MTFIKQKQKVKIENLIYELRQAFNNPTLGVSMSGDSDIEIHIENSPDNLEKVNGIMAAHDPLRAPYPDAVTIPPLDQQVTNLQKTIADLTARLEAVEKKVK